MPGAFEELQHQDAHSLADGPERGSHGGGGFALAGTGIDHDETAADVGHRGEVSIVRGRGGGVPSARRNGSFVLQKMGGWAILQDHIRNEVAVRSMPGSVVL